MVEEKFDLWDIAIVPAIWSAINSRSEINTHTKFGKLETLPLMAAPMDTVVSEENIETFITNGVVPCMPRGMRMKAIHSSQYFQAFGLQEIEEQLENYIHLNEKAEFSDFNNILIDIANGHMKKLVTLVKEIKKHFPDIKIMVGNIANPYTYRNLAEAGADYIRCSIGTGAGCTTAANVAINYPLGSLISECKKIKEDNHLDCKIIADGGMQGYDDIIKALALGADYVMLGSMFNKAYESAGFNYWKTKLGYFRIKNEKVLKYMWSTKYAIYKKYRGMSTKSVQKRWGKGKLTTAEGITKFQKIEYTLAQWLSNFEDYLKSNMSYCEAANLSDFIGEVEWVFITQNALKRYKK